MYSSIIECAKFTELCELIWKQIRLLVEVQWQFIIQLKTIICLLHLVDLFVVGELFYHVQLNKDLMNIEGSAHFI